MEAMLSTNSEKKRKLFLTFLFLYGNVSLWLFRHFLFPLKLKNLSIINPDFFLLLDFNFILSLIKKVYITYIYTLAYTFFLWFVNQMIMKDATCAFQTQ